jgi:hypothetical protein
MAGIVVNVADLKNVAAQDVDRVLAEAERDFLYAECNTRLKQVLLIQLHSQNM